MLAGVVAAVGVAILAVVLVVATGAAEAVLGRILIVESPRRAVVRVGGKVPGQEGIGSIARVLWSLCNTEGGGMITGQSCNDDRGRKDARRVNESMMAWANRKG